MDPSINFSDHVPLLACFSCSTLSTPDRESPRSHSHTQLQLRWDKANLDYYYRATGTLLQPTLHKLEDIILCHKNKQITDSDVNSCIDCLYNEIVSVIGTCASAAVPKTRKGFYKFWWDEELDLLKEAAMNANNIWKAVGKPKQGQVFVNRQQTRLQYRRKIREGQKLQTNTYTNELHDALIKKNSTTFWNCWKSKFGSDRNKCEQVDGSVDAVTVANNFARHFSSTFTCNNTNRMKALEDEYNDMRLNYWGMPLPGDSSFDVELVSNVIFKLKRGKATDLFGLSAEHLLFCHPVISVLLSKLFCLIISTRYIPVGFKYSYIVPVPKPKDCRTKAMTCDDFRAIAISPILSKVFEHCFLSRLQGMLETTDNQFGFKKGVGCSHAIYTVYNIVQQATSSGSTVNVCAIDLSKAFDKVNHNALFIKLMKRKIPVILLELLENLFRVCYSCIKWNDVMSSFFTINFGVRQGSVLSPYLFAVYVNDVDYSSASCHVILYADDILLIASSVSELEKLLHKCENELHWLDMSINLKKSCCLRVGKRCNATCANISCIKGQQLQWVNEIKYLGIHIVKAKSFKCDVRDAKRSFYRTANEIFGKIGRFASEEVTLQLIQSKCMPALLYGLDACPLNKTAINSLDYVVNQFFMKLFCTSDINVVHDCQSMFNFKLPSEQLKERKEKFIHRYEVFVSNRSHVVLCV